MLVSTMPSPRAHIQEAISPAVACSVCAAWKTITAELVKPTRTATKPALRADSEKSSIRRMTLPAAAGARCARLPANSRATGLA